MRIRRRACRDARWRQCSPAAPKPAFGIRSSCGCTRSPPAAMVPYAVSQKCQSTAIEDALRNSSCMLLDAVRQNKTGAALEAAPVERRSPTSVNEAGTGRLFQRRGERAIFRAVGAAQFADPGQVVLRLITIALFELPQPVILPGPHMVRVGLERPLVPDLRDLVVAELAVGIADQVGDIGAVVLAERLQLLDGGGIIVAVVNRRIGRAIAVDEARIGDAGALVGLLVLLGLGVRLGV